MKRIEFMVVLMLAAALIGCAAPRQFSAPPALVVQPVIQGGVVPVDIQNPALLEQEVLIFWGSDPVEIIPDARTGGWMYSRPAIKALRIGMAHSESNWHNYVRVMLPRNSSFVLAGRTMNFWGKGSPYFIGFSTGSTPFVYRYTTVTPYMSPSEAGGLVMLQNRPIMPFGSGGPLRIEYTIDLRSIGRGIANGITNGIYGR